MAGLLVTGLDAFADLETNVSEAVVRALPEVWRHPLPLATEVLPTAYVAAGERVRELIACRHPQAIVLLGVARARAVVQIERVALNLDDSPTPDNMQSVRCGERIDARGPVGYWSTLPLAALAARLEEMGVPAVMSNHAGTFLCNHVFYVARAEIERCGPERPCGFIHLPEIDAGSDRGFETVLTAVVACLEVVADAVS